MFGWINDCTEQLIITKFGVDTWHRVKERAGCTVDDGGFVRHAKYDDASTVALVVAASEELGLPVPDVLEVFGQYFMEFTRNEGYENLLSCQGGTLRTWLANVNALHDHLEASLPKGFVKPVFWCEDDDENGSVLLHYFSQRGSLLAPVVKGVVKEVARYHFDVEINMEEEQLQDHDNAKYSTWRIAAKNKDEAWKLDTRQRQGGSSQAPPLHSTHYPFATSLRGNDDTGKENLVELVEKQIRTNGNKQPTEVNVHAANEISMSCADMKMIFPFHIVLDRSFIIRQVGDALPPLLHTSDESILGSNIGSWLKITQPVYGEWESSYLGKIKNQTFFMEAAHAVLKGNWVSISSGHILLILSPDVKNVKELQELGLTMSDLPLSSFQRDAVFLGEHITSEVNSSNKLDKLSKKLRNERNLSNKLLYSVLPKFVAKELREGKTVDPKFYNDVTVLFSDIVSFTTISSQIPQWMVIDMLNRLFCIMDFLCKHFGLYKIDTIGDAFICCSGLPMPRADHAQAVANFAIAVQHCIKQVMDPSNDCVPIQLQIGIHVGPCVSGVVGMSTPKFTVLGDTMNCASRHESTSVPGKTQISKEMFDALSQADPCFYRMSYRGLVNMKGKGALETYWLDGVEKGCPNVGEVELERLYDDVQLLLATGTFSKRQYFSKGTLRQPSIHNLDLQTSDLDDDASFMSQSSIDGIF